MIYLFIHFKGTQNQQICHKKNDMRMQSNTSTPYQQNDNGKKMPQCPRFNLKDLLYPPGRLTRPKKYAFIGMWA